MLDKQLKKSLCTKAQTLKPVVMIGGNGLTDNVLNEIDIALTAHELIKIRISAADRETRDLLIATICEKSHSELVQKIGHVISVYRKKTKNG